MNFSTAHLQPHPFIPASLEIYADDPFGLIHCPTKSRLFIRLAITLHG